VSPVLSFESLVGCFIGNLDFLNLLFYDYVCAYESDDDFFLNDLFQFVHQ